MSTQIRKDREKRLEMARDEMRARHTRSLEENEKYREVWEKARTYPEDMQLIAAMAIWDAELRVTTARKANSAAT